MRTGPEANDLRRSLRASARAGMGEVLTARDMGVDRIVGIKVSMHG